MEFSKPLTCMQKSTGAKPFGVAIESRPRRCPGAGVMASEGPLHNTFRPTRHTQTHDTLRPGSCPLLRLHKTCFYHHNTLRTTTMDGEWASPWADDVDSHHPPPPPPPPPAPLTSDSVLPLSKPSSKLDDDPWGAFTDSAAWADAGDEGEASFDGPAEAEGKKNDGTETFSGWGQELGLELGDSKINASEEVKTNGHDVNRFSTLGMAQIEDWGWGSLEVGDVDEGRKMDEVPSLSATAAREKVENIGSGDDWGWSDAVSDRPSEEKIKGTLEQISGSEEKEKITNSEGWGVDTEDANPTSTGPAQESLDTTSTVKLTPSRTTNEAEKSSPSPEPPADELALDSPKDEVTDNEAEEEPDKPVTSEEVSDKDREEMTDKSTTPAPEALGITTNMPPDGDAEDDDFGDFVSEPEELEGTDATEPAKPPDSSTPLSPTSPTSPRSHAFHTAPLDTVKADLSLVSKLYPVPTSYPAPPPLEHSIISSTEAYVFCI